MCLLWPITQAHDYKFLSVTKLAQELQLAKSIQLGMLNKKFKIQTLSIIGI